MHSTQKGAIAALAALALTGTAVAQTTVRVSEGAGGVEAAGSSGGPDVSADGRHVVFSTTALNLTGGAAGTSQIMAHDRDPDGNGVFDEGNGVTSVVSASVVGAASNGASNLPSVSGDGRYVAYQSSATDLVANDLNGKTDVFVTDRDPDGNGLFEPTSYITWRLDTAQGLAPNGHSTEAHVSLDGHYVAFLSQATNMVVPDANGATTDVFRYDRWTGQVVRVNSTPSGTSPDGPSSQPEISGDGSRVVFYSVATNLVAGPLSGFGDLYCRDFPSGGMVLMNKNSNGDLANGVCDRVAISADGKTIAFSSHATNLDAQDTDFNRDVYVRDLSTGVTELVSIDSFGVKGETSGTIVGHEPSLSSDGSVVCFWSRSTNLYYNQNNLTDIYVHDRTTGQTAVASVDSAGYSGNQSSGDFSGNRVSADGGTVVFASLASNLVASDTNGLHDVFAHELCNSLLDFGNERIGSNGASPVLEGCGGLATGQQLTFRLRHAPAMARSAIYVSLASNPRQWMGGTLVPGQPLTRTLVKTDPNGEASFTLNAGGGLNVFAQWLVRDGGMPGLGFSNAVCAPMQP